MSSRSGRNSNSSRTRNFDLLDPPGQSGQLEQGTLENVRRFLSDEDEMDLEDIVGRGDSWKRSKTGGLRGESDRPSLLDSAAKLEISRSSRFRADAGDSAPSNMPGDFGSNNGEVFEDHQKSFKQPKRGIFSSVGDAFVDFFYTLSRPCYATSEYCVASTGPCYRCLGCERKSRKKKLLCFAMFAFAALAIAAIAVRLSGNDETTASSETSSPGGESVDVTPQSPNNKDDGMIDLNNARFDSILEYISNSGVSLEEDLNSDDTPQNKALQWLAHVDGAKLKVGHFDMLQRYAMATLYFATSGDLGEWNNDEKWMTKEHICNWHGVECGTHGLTNVALKVRSATGGWNPHVIHLNLTTNNLSGFIPPEMSVLEKLKTLSLAENNLEGTIPATLGTLHVLALLELQENALSGTLPTEIAQCTNLRDFHVDKNSLNGRVPTELRLLKDMRNYGLSDNGFTGPLPDITAFGHLRKVDLCSNEFTGDIPTEYGKISGLVELHLGNNKLHGPIPAEIGRLGHLTSFYVSDNNVSGPIPQTIGAWKEMKDFRINGNKISGEIPMQLTHVATLEYLHLEDNQMTGAIPEAFAKLKRLREFTFYENDFTGDVPKTLCDRGATLELLAGDCSEVTCDCCDKCYR